MQKLTRNAGATGLATAMVAAALLASGTSAAATTPSDAGHTATRATAAHSSQNQYRHTGHRRCMDPWVAGQVATFDPVARHRLAVYDPWVKDQLTRFVAPAC
ncbi:hypothetical protein [Streptomyces sp. NPDC046759]|uniref:hypothetical protein n=1 Tax=Streptomyces sp. NPDC046759 TaxID=3155019 RepID=UPI0033FA17B9